MFSTSRGLAQGHARQDQKGRAATRARLAKATLDRLEFTDRRMDETDGRIKALVDSQIQTGDRMDEADKRLAALIDSQIRAGDRMEETDKRLASLLDSQIRTEETVRNLAAAVDRYFSEGRNGKSDSES